MKKDVLFAIVGTLAVAAICFGVASLKPQTPPLPSPPVTTTARAEQQPVVGTVIMRVNGQPVTQREFELFVSTLPEQMQPYAITPVGRKKVAEQLARLIVLQQEAQKLGAQRDPEVWARLTLGEANLVAQWAAEKLAGTPNEAQLRAEYEKHRAEFSSFELSHILVAYQGAEIPAKDGKTLTAEQAMKKAEQIEAQLRSGAQFERLASAVSDDATTGAQGGRLGNVSPGQLPPDLQQAVVGLKPGEISKPIQSRFGIHIFKMGGRTTQPFEQLKPGLQRQAQQVTISTAIDKLQRSANVQLDPKYFSSAPSPGIPQAAPLRPPNG
jgi:peptidyl-prolyl cis-trans isomerase C